MLAPLTSLTGGDSERLTLQVAVIGIQQFNTTMNNIDNRVENSTQVWQNQGSMIGGTVATAFGVLLAGAIMKALDLMKRLGGAVIGWGIGAVKEAADFEEQITDLAIAAGVFTDQADDTTGSIAEFEQAAFELGKDVNILNTDANDAAEGMLVLYKAGLSAEEIFGPEGLQGAVNGTTESYGAFKTATDLAAVSGLELEKAAELGVAIMATFGDQIELTGDASTDAALKQAFLEDSLDVITRVSDSTITNIEDFSGALKNVGPTAAGFGFNLTEVSQALGILSQRGLSANEAGTALRRMLANLNRDTKKVREANEELGVSLFDSEGNLRNLEDVMRDYSSALATGPDSIVTSTIYVKDATADQMALNNEAIDVYESMTEKIDLHNAGLHILSDTTLTKYQEQQAAANRVMAEYGEIGVVAKEVTSQLTEEERANHIQTLAGVYGQNAFNALISEGGEGFANLSVQMEGATGFSERLDVKLQTTTAQLEKVESFVKTASLELKVGFKNSIVGVLGPLVEWLDKTGLINDVLDVLVGVMEVVGGVISEKLIEVIEQLPGSLEEVMTWWDSLVEGFETGTSFIEEYLVPILEMVWDWISQLAPIIQDVAQTYIYGYLIPAYEALWQQIQENVIPAIQQVIDFLGEYVPIAIDLLNTWWETVLKPIFELLSDLIVNVVIPIVGDLVGIFLSLLIPAFKAVADFVVTNVVPALLKLWNWFNEKIIPVLKIVVEWLKDNLVPAIEDLKIWVADELIPVLIDLWNKFNDSIIPILKDVAEFIGDVVDVIVDDVIPAVVDWIKEMRDKLEPIIRTISDFIVNTVIPKWKEFKSDVIDPLIQVFKDLWDSLDPIRTILETIVGWFNTLKDALSKFELPDWLRRSSPPPLYTSLMEIAGAMDYIADRSAPAMAEALGAMAMPLASSVSSVDNSVYTDHRNYNLETNTLLEPGQLALEFREMELSGR